jgi:beta-alanine degradation protein BauB
MNRTVALSAVGITAVLFVASAVWSEDRPAATQRIPEFENAHVKVWKSTVVRNAPLPLHRHDHGRVIIALQGGTMKIEDQSGTSETHVWETGKAYWLPANPPNTMHRDINVSDHPIEVMVVEVEDDK